jgi:hypothetical protein
MLRVRIIASLSGLVEVYYDKCDARTRDAVGAQADLSGGWSLDGLGSTVVACVARCP